MNKNKEKWLQLADINSLEILNHTVSEGKVIWKGRVFESAIDYVLVNQWARIFVDAMAIDEEG